MVNPSETEDFARYWSARRAFERVLTKIDPGLLGLTREDVAQMLAELELYSASAPKDPAGEPEFLTAYWREWAREAGVPDPSPCA